jgi:hypothetical protein
MNRKKNEKKKKVTKALGPRGTFGVGHHYRGVVANAMKRRLELSAGHDGKPLLQVAQQRLARRMARHEADPVADADERRPRQRVPMLPHRAFYIPYNMLVYKSPIR